MFEAVPEGNYVLIKGDPGDPNASTFLPQGWDEAGLQDKIDAGEITIVDDQFTDAWDTETAQNNMEAIIDAANAEDVQIDAVLAENDSTALGVVAALQAKGYDTIPVSGQDGDTANLQNVAKGLQYVDVWKDANELGQGRRRRGAAAVRGHGDGGHHAPGWDGQRRCRAGGRPDRRRRSRPRVRTASRTRVTRTTITSFILKPQPITAENLDLIIDSGWLTQEELCEGVDAAAAPAACQ